MMFAIGEATTQVYSSKLRLPKEYNLRRKDREIFGVWIGERMLYLSDEVAPLRARAGKSCIVFKPNIDYECRIEVPTYLENKEACIKGCITTIQVEFRDERRKNDV